MTPPATAPLRIGVHGATGRMGALVRAGVEAAPDLALAWACGRGGLAGLSEAERGAAEVIIDFSTPDGLRALLAAAAERGLPVVSGTTGAALPETTGIPFLHAANFSIGVAVLARLVAAAAQALPGFDAEIIEIHHSAKRDAPSGTALRLAAALQGGRDGELVNGRSGLRAPGSVGVHAVRAGDVIGEHTVLLAGAGERLELRHIASQRSVFASGAITAARWLHGRPPGRYRIEDVIGDVTGNIAAQRTG